MPHKYALIIAGAEEIVKSFFCFSLRMGGKNGRAYENPLAAESGRGVGLPEFFVRGAYRKLEMP